MTQCERILNHLKRFGSITPKDAETEYGCMRLGARIFDLKRRGFPIITGWEETVNRFGEKTRYARYYLVNER